jgi:hypothetical protein
VLLVGARCVVASDVVRFLRQSIRTGGKCVRLVRDSIGVHCALPRAPSLHETDYSDDHPSRTEQNSSRDSCDRGQRS